MGIMAEDKIVFKKIGEIRPYVRNPRNNAKTVELLCELIPKVGFNVPLVIDQNGIIVKGHARYAAAIRLGMTEVPCIVSHASEDAVKVDRITDNKIAEFSEWMDEELSEEIDSIDLDLGDLGFSRAKVEEDIKTSQNDAQSLVGAPQPQSEPVGVPKKYYKCVCAECGHVMFVEAGKLKR